MATKTEGNTLEHDTISIERTGKSDSYLCNRLFETKQNTALHTKSFPGPDQDTITPVEAIKIDTMETTETSGLETTNASETTKPETTVTIEETYLQTLIAPFTPQSIHRETMISANQKGQETMPTYEAIHLKTRRKTEGNRTCRNRYEKETRHRGSTDKYNVRANKCKDQDNIRDNRCRADITGRGSKDKENIKGNKEKLRKKSDGIFEITDNQNSTLVLAAPKSGPSFAEKTEQKILQKRMILKM
ncbi:unnamed protein product [Mytilus edulis]|uniref:Uncharacterized protein n=1 Tax=Mytilus edulis TaxID=6550 RepID=A0A8S3VK19_MYTED|nr:unnamed protein product [Mytilus edulis]